jgi:hypothetical protein
MNSSLSVHAYSAKTGAHWGIIPYTSCSWSDSINEPGTMSVGVVFSPEFRKIRLNGQTPHEALRPWKTILAVQDGARVLHAGPMTSRKWDANERKLSISCGGGWTLLSKRLVLNYNLARSFRDGNISTDDDHPTGDWALTFVGSYQDIARGLIAETLKWGQLPITLPAKQGGMFTRTYAGWDLATVSDRIRDLTNLEHAQEYRFSPRISSDGMLTFAFESASEIIDHKLNLNAIVPNGQARYDGGDEDGDPTTSQVWATGGKGQDETLMCCVSLPSDYLDPDMPLLQTTNTEHTTVSELATLQAHARAQASSGAWPSESHTIYIRSECDPHVGDWADLHIDDDYMGNRSLSLKITDVKGSADSDWVTVQCRERA